LERYAGEISLHIIERVRFLPLLLFHFKVKKAMKKWAENQASVKPAPQGLKSHRQYFNIFTKGHRD